MLFADLDPTLRVWANAGMIILCGLLVWLIGRLVIRIVVRGVARGNSFFRSRSDRWEQNRWVPSSLRPEELERRSQRAQTIGSLLTSLLGVITIILVIIYLLLNIGINVAPLLASLGILGVAVGFGCQQLIRDFLAGICIMIEDQYGIGDVIETSDVVGTVQSLGLRITQVLADDGTIWYLRNGEILQLGNRSQGNYQPKQNSDQEEA